MRGVKAALLVFAGFGLSYHEPGAPRYVWLALLIPLALLPLVPQGWARRVLTAGKWLAMLALVLVLVPFIGKQIQQALYNLVNNSIDSIRQVGQPGRIDLTVRLDGAEVVTVESLDTADKLSPVQEAFIEASAFQCGYCTPGFIMMVTRLLDENPDPTDDQIKHYLTGNLCRCGNYNREVAAVLAVATLYVKSDVYLESCGMKMPGASGGTTWDGTLTTMSPPFTDDGAMLYCSAIVPVTLFVAFAPTPTMTSAPAGADTPRSSPAIPTPVTAILRSRPCMVVPFRGWRRPFPTTLVGFVKYRGAGRRIGWSTVDQRVGGSARARSSRSGQARASVARNSADQLWARCSIKFALSFRIGPRG